MKYYLITLAVLFASCKKEAIPFINCSNPTSNIETCKKIILGKWNWRYERYLDRITQTYIFKTPSTEGYTSQIEFKSSLLASIYKNSLFEKDVKYSITTLDKVTNVASDNSITTIIIYDIQNGSRTDFTPINMCNDTLSLNYNYYSDTKGQQKWSKN